MARKFNFKRKLTSRFGKIIDTNKLWIDNREYEVEVRMQKDTQYGTEYKYAMVYVAQAGTETNPWGVLDYVISKDVNELPDKIEEAIRRRYQVNWKDMILVSVTRPDINSRHSSNERASIGIKILRYQTGVRESDGSKCYRELSFGKNYADKPAHWYPSNSIHNEESPSASSFRDERVGNIEYTDESWEKLVCIVKAIESLRLKAIDILTGDDLPKQLAQISLAGFMLPEAPKEPEDVEG